MPYANKDSASRQCRSSSLYCFLGPELFALVPSSEPTYHSTFNIQPRMSWQGTIKHKTQRKKLSLSEVRGNCGNCGRRENGKGERGEGKAKQRKKLCPRRRWIL